MVIQSVLAFILGLLAATLAAILIAPAFYRRAVRLTRKRLEATLPMSLNEIQAEKDRVRAEAAMQARRLEIEGRAHQTRANERAVAIAKLEERIKACDLAASEDAAAIASRDATIADIEAKLAAEKETTAGVAARLAEAEQRIEAMEQVHEDLTRRNDEITLISSNRQIDLVSRDNEIERLNATIAQLRAQRGDHAQKARDESSAAFKASEALKQERRRIAELERRNERLLSDLSDRDERLERREKTIQSLQDQLGSGGSVAKPADNQPDLQAALDEQKRQNGQLRRDLRRIERSEEALRLELTEVQAAAMRLEAEIADMTERGAKSAGGAHSSDTDAALAKLEADRDRLEAQLLSLAAENERLRQQPSEESGTAVMGANGHAYLRDELAQIAAQMVHMTRVLEGPDSPIETALSAKGRVRRKADKPTLADRIRALQAAASASEAAEPVKGNR